MDKAQILSEILHHTGMMESALDAEDFEVFEMSLDARGTLIDILETSGFSPDTEDETVLRQVSIIHERAMEKLLRLKERTGTELESVRAQRLSIAKTRQVQNRYQGFIDAGGNMDTKK